MSQEQQRKLTKKIKVNIQNTYQELDFSTLLYEKFDTLQIKMLAEHVESLQQYQKVLSLQIRHQEKSLSTLPKHIINRFPQLNQRVNKLIQKGKLNVQFMDILLLPYKSLISSNILLNQNQIQQQHSHNHSHYQHSTMVNMFHQLASQWSEQGQQLKYIDYIRQYLSKFYFNAQKRQLSQNNQIQSKLLIIGCGMGRILYEIQQKYKQYNCFLQAHEQMTEKYLCAQYFLNRCSKIHQIHPYIHNFSNYLKNEDAYRSVKIPFQLKTSGYFYPITLGKFCKLYRHHEDEWNVLVTIYQNYHIQDILLYIKLIYKILKKDGIWIDVCTSDFDANIVPFSYKEYCNILQKSQFKQLQKLEYKDYWFKDNACLMNEIRGTYIRVMQKC